jgi:hypothetical protein
VKRIVAFLETMGKMGLGRRAWATMKAGALLPNVSCVSLGSHADDRVIIGDVWGDGKRGLFVCSCSR